MSVVTQIRELGFQAAGKAAQVKPLGRSLVRFSERNGGPRFQILVYHRVLPDFDPFVISMVTSRTFARQMRILRDCYRPVSLDTLLEELDGNRLKPGTVAVTFDDGYRDNHDHAWPILKQFGIPATIYLATGLTGTNGTGWYDKVLAAMRAPASGRFTFAPAGVVDADIAEPMARARVTYGILEWLKGFGPAERDAHIAALERARGHIRAAGDRLMLDWEEARSMQASRLIAIGAHTVNHPILSRLPAAEMESEIRDSKAALENGLQAPVSHFAYPNGRPGDYTPETIGLLARYGFKSAVTTIHGVNRPGTSRFEWLRRQPWEDSADSFAFRFLAERLRG